jgi:hypothetical protein
MDEPERMDGRGFGASRYAIVVMAPERERYAGRMSSKKLPVSISVFPTLDYIELIQFDEKTGEIEKATSLPCQFDPATRQMVDRDQMMQTIRDIYTVNRVPSGTPVILVLPSFFTREIELPAEFSKDELRFALVSEAERFYIFKKLEPQIDWVNLDENRLLYSAFPKTEIEKYVQIFKELHIPILGIELSYFSIMRGLVATGVIGGDEIARRERWCLLAISDTSMYASIQEGMKIQKTTDAPLSAASEEDQAVIDEIHQDFESFISNEQFDKLVLVNNSRSLDSDRILGGLSSVTNLILVEQNAVTLRSRGSDTGQFPCSLEGIGGVFYQQFPELPSLNFLPETGEDLVGIMQYRKLAFKWLLIGNGALFLLCILIWGLLGLINWQKEQEAKSLAEQAGELGASANPAQLVEVDRKKYIKQVVDQNVVINNFAVKVGNSLKDNNVWLEKVELSLTKPEEPIQIALEGKAIQLDPVNQLVQGLNNGLEGATLEVANAAQATSPDGQSYFTWVIQNKGAAKTDANGNPIGSSAPGGG